MTLLNRILLGWPMIWITMRCIGATHSFARCTAMISHVRASMMSTAHVATKICARAVKARQGTRDSAIFPSAHGSLWKSRFGTRLGRPTTATTGAAAGTAAGIAAAVPREEKAFGSKKKKTTHPGPRQYSRPPIARLRLAWSGSSLQTLQSSSAWQF